MKFAKLVASFVSVFLVGCAGTGGKLDPASHLGARVPEGYGIVLLSTGAPTSCVSTATLLKVLPSEASYFDRAIASIDVDGYVRKSDFEDHQGSLSAIALPAGNYYFAESISNPYVRPVQVPKAEFSVKAGEIVYMGEYYKPVSCVWNPVSQFSDRQGRDIELLIKKNPAFASANITKRIAKFSGYADLK